MKVVEPVLIANKSNMVLMQCRTRVRKDAVRRENIDGVEHIIVSSSTLPDNVVMNGVLYPAEEIAASYSSLERTLAPVEHPVDSQGNFLPASDPEAIHNFHAGAFNTNVRREDGRVHIDKTINVTVAAQTEKGRELLSRIEELETNDKARPVHTSVGVWLVPEILAEPQTNDEGEKYHSIARDMTFDHDAILLESVGAATPEKGVGLAVNGEKCDVIVNDEILDEGEETPILSHEELRDALYDKLNTPPLTADWIDRVFDDKVVYRLGDKLFEVPYRVDGELVTIVGVPLAVKRDVKFTPETNSKGDAMKEIIVNALKEAGIKTDGLDDDALMAAYNKLQADKAAESGDGKDTDSIAEAVTNALKPVTDRLDGIEEQLTQNADQKINDWAELVGNSDKYPGIDVEKAKTIPADTLKDMAAECQESFGLPHSQLSTNDGGLAENLRAPTEMPA